MCADNAGKTQFKDVPSARENGTAPEAVKSRTGRNTKHAVNFEH